MTLLYEVVDAYLSPLLIKHEAGERLVWEDLLASHAAATKVLGSSENTFVSIKAEKMHNSQVKAYRDSAVEALGKWAQSVPLEPMEDTDTKESFVKRCTMALESGKAEIPNWKIGNRNAVVHQEIAKRATEIFEKYHPMEEDEDGQVEPSEGEEGELDVAQQSEEGEADTDTEEIKKYVPPKKRAIKNQKPKDKVAPRKKGTATKKKFAGNQRGKKNAGGGNNKKK